MVKLIMISSTKFVEQYVKDISASLPSKKLWIFDFDDTLVMSDSVTHVTTVGGHKFDLTPAQFAVYDKQPGDDFDYSDFRRLINPRPITWMNKIFDHVHTIHGPEAMAVLSARCAPDPIVEYLTSIGKNDVEIVTVDSGSPILKMAWTIEAIRTRKLEAIDFFDDSPKNVHAIDQIKELYPRVAIRSWHVRQDSVSFL